MQPTSKSLFDVLVAGGPLLWPIFAASVVMLLVVIERFAALRRKKVAPGPFVKCVLSQIEEGELDRDAALELCEEDPSHIARVFEAGIRRWGKPAVEVEQAILDEGERTANSLRSYLRLLNGVANVSPLLGLFGTVWGIMHSFDALSASAATGRSELLAGGISEALITTAAGLAVAIPAMVAYMFFVGRVDSLVMEIDRRGQQLVHLISAEALSGSRMRRTKKAA